MDSVDVDDALLYEQVSVPDEDNAFIPLIAAMNLLHRVEDECADEDPLHESTCPVELRQCWRPGFVENDAEICCRNWENDALFDF